MKKKTVIPVLITTLVLTLIISFQNCSDIRLNTLSKPSINVCRDKYQIEAYRNTNSAVFTVHDLQANLLQIHENFHWTVLNENNEVVYQQLGSSQLELREVHLANVGTCAPLKIKIDRLNCEEIPVEYEPFIWGDNCEEEPPEPPTCEEDPTQPHCEAPAACGDVPSVFDLTVKEFDAPISEGGFGTSFDRPMGNTIVHLKNNILPGTDPNNSLSVPLVSAQVKSWRFTVPANKSGGFYFGMASDHGHITSISKGCPAKFTTANGVSIRCRSMTNNNFGLEWSSDGSNTGCVLEPGETYYLNMIFTEYSSSGINNTPPAYLNSCASSCSLSGECTCKVMFSKSMH